MSVILEFLKILIKLIMQFLSNGKAEQLPASGSQVKEVEHKSLSNITPTTDTISSNYPSPVIPSRNENELTGTQVGQKIINISGQARENILLQECLNGNIPDFMRNFVEVVISENGNTIKYYVSPDVLCVGNNNDFLRIPLYPTTYRKIADNFNCALITSKMSRQIWNAADLKLTPQPKGAPYDTSMEISPTYIWHNQQIENQRTGKDFKLLTGHKKDVIFNKNLLDRKNNVCIYGWIFPNGKIIQSPPNYVSHAINYADYSHSGRLVHQTVIVNNQPMNFYDVLNHQEFASLISDEGAYDARNIYK